MGLSTSENILIFIQRQADFYLMIHADSHPTIKADFDPTIGLL